MTDAGNDKHPHCRGATEIFTKFDKNNKKALSRSDIFVRPSSPLAHSSTHPLTRSPPLLLCRRRHRALAASALHPAPSCLAAPQDMVSARKNAMDLYGYIAARPLCFSLPAPSFRQRSHIAVC